MPKLSLIDMLPADVRTELDALIAEKGYRRGQEISDWLIAKGHKIGYLSVTRYINRLKQIHFATDRMNGLPKPAMDLIRLRLECAAIAAQSGAGDRLLEKADEILMWAFAPLD